MNAGCSPFSLQFACQPRRKSITISTSHPSDAPRCSRSACSFPYKGASFRLLAPVEPDEDAAPPKRMAFKPCPRCGAEGAKRVLFTPWGSFYGPALFNHVRCPECRYAYNGRSGGSNLIPAILFVTVPLVLMAAIICYLALLIIPRL